jgi:protein-arginine kinase activator protein McsA
MPQTVVYNQNTHGAFNEGLDQMNVDNKTAQELNRLNELKRTAVDNEDYEEAKRLKLKIDRFKLVVGQIHELETEKNRAVEMEDYDSAKRVKIQIDRLRNEALMDNKYADQHDHNNNQGQYYSNQSRGREHHHDNQPAYNQG